MIQEQRKFSMVGNSVHHVDGVDKVTGKAKYTGDLVIPEVAEGKFLRSPYAHARIRSIDTREAEAMAGVIAVLTSKDFTDISPYMGRSKNKDHPIIAVDRAIFAGQPVAAVAAVDRATAEGRSARSTSITRSYPRSSTSMRQWPTTHRAFTILPSEISVSKLSWLRETWKRVLPRRMRYSKTRSS